jgi:hypothetical protein
MSILFNYLTLSSQPAALSCAAASGPNVYVTWQDTRDGNWEIYFKRSTDRGASWDPDLRLTSDSSWSQNPQIACTDTVLPI